MVVDSAIGGVWSIGRLVVVVVVYKQALLVVVVVYKQALVGVGRAGVLGLGAVQWNLADCVISLCPEGYG